MIGPTDPAGAQEQATTTVDPDAPTIYQLGRPWYVSAGVGAVITIDAANRGEIDIESGYNPGISANGALGYAWESGFRLEGQVWYQHFTLDRISTTNPGNISGLSDGGQGASGDISTLGLYLNLAYDFDTGTRLRPFLLGGPGAVRIRYEDWRTDTGVAIVNDDDWRLGFQFGGGLNYVISRRFSAELSYRFAFSLDPRMRDVTGDAFNSEFGSHNFLVSARYGF